MNWREVGEADLMECLSIQPLHLGDEIVGRDKALAIWRELIRSLSLNGCVIECASVPGRILGFGASVFVTSDFATREIEDPRPGMNSRILASIANGESVVRAEADLSDVNADDALDVVTLYGGWAEGVLSPEQLMNVQMLLAISYVDAHTEYRLNRLLAECIGEVQCEYIASSGVWRTANKFAERGHQLSVMTRAEAFSVSGSIAASLFQYQEPILGLRKAEKQLLAGALRYRSDSELAARMNLSPATIKKRWQALFERIGEIRPELLPADEREGGTESRGPQKRHHILSYVGAHPEELRPLRWRSGSKIK